MATMTRVERPTYVMRAELLQLFRISPTRLVTLQKEPDFPKPVEELVAGKLYRYSDIETYAKAKGRTLYPLGEIAQPGRRHAQREP